MAGRFRLIAAAVSLLAAPAPARAQRWSEVRTPHFQVVTDAAPRAARRMALRLERFRAAVEQVFPEAPAEDAVPVTVLLFRNSGSMRPFLPLHEGRPEIVAGLFLGGHDRHYMAIDGSAGPGSYATLLHEYVHLLNARAGRMPLWMNEGLAELYGRAEVDGEQVHVGGPAAEHLRVLGEGRLLPLLELLEADYGSPHYHEADMRGLFYAQSWALVHYLLLGPAGQPRALRLYLDALAAGQAPAAASRTAWGLEPAALQKELARYARGWIGTGVRVAVAAVPEAQVSGRPLSAAEAEAYRGDFLVHDKRLGEARPYLERAMALDPALALPYRSLGLAHYYAKDLGEALRWLGAAIERDPQDPVARYFRVRATLESAGSVIGPALAAAVHDDLKVAVARAPRLLDARELLARVERVLDSATRR